MFEKLKSYAARQLELDADEITPDSTFESLGIDSLDVVEMIMGLESVFAVLGGWWLLGETMTPWETTGCVLVFAAVILSQLPTSLFRKKA